MPEPQWPLPIAERGNDAMMVHKSIMIALLNAVGGALAINEFDLVSNYDDYIIEQKLTDYGTMTLQVREITRD